jgi:hypothetical protein
MSEAVSSLKCEVLSEESSASSRPSSDFTLKTSNLTRSASDESYETKPISGGASSLKCQVLSRRSRWSGLETSHFTLHTRPKAVRAKQSQLAPPRPPRDPGRPRQLHVGVTPTWHGLPAHEPSAEPALSEAEGMPMPRSTPGRACPELAEGMPVPQVRATPTCNWPAGRQGFLTMAPCLRYDSRFHEFEPSGSRATGLRRLRLWK